MTQKILLSFCFLIGFSAFSQKKSKEFRSKTIAVKKDSIKVDSVSINPQYFKVFSANKKLISSEEYQINFVNSLLIINSKKYPKITIEYLRYPDFITKTYSPFDKKLIVPNTSNTGKLYSETKTKKTQQKLFEGLDTKGFISRGITVGNNQNAVTNSSLDLTIEGKLSKDVGIRASIFDTNFPLQQGGYSQNITDFDRVFIELFSKNWKLKAGDIKLQNDESYFLKFNKQISGVEISGKPTKNLSFSASGAVARGTFNSFKFTGIEGNQGPYKILGTNNETGVIIINGTEKVFVNGILINPKNYAIDYNLAQITFATKFPITNNMRVVIEYQTSNRNYTRFLTYNTLNYKKDAFTINSYFYSEKDVKSAPLQENLNENQKIILSNAGNDTSKMIAESAFVDVYDANRIQYKKVGTTFVFSNNADDELYNVIFTNIGTNNGDYVLDQQTAIGAIFKYVGTNLGDYSPVKRLIAPEKIETFVVNSNYNPSKKTSVTSEIALSNNDKNLFSTIDNNQNNGIAFFTDWKQVLSNKKWQLESNLFLEYKDEYFATEQRFTPVEFLRNWNILTEQGNKTWLEGSLSLKKDSVNFISYGFGALNYTGNSDGKKHFLRSKFQHKKTLFTLESSYLKSTNPFENGTFFKLNSIVEHSFTKSWLGAKTNLETNKKTITITNNNPNNSHRFKEFETYFGIGDSTNIFVKLGVNYRENDSIKNTGFTQINNRKSFFVDSRLINSKNTQLSLFANYRFTKNTFTKDEQTLNSSINYKQRLFNNFLVFNTVYETASGAIAQQDFVYIKTEPGQGFYTWIDYNEDGIQQFNEFEVAQFQDQADYLRVALPNLRFLPTQRVKFKQGVFLNFKHLPFKNKNNFLAKLQNQTQISVDNEQEKQENDYNFNPFNFSNVLGLNYSIKNNLYFNKNLEHFSTTYTYGNNEIKQQLGFGAQENLSTIHKISFAHKLSNFWLLNFDVSKTQNNLITENLANRNYQINAENISPKISFLQNNTNKFSVFYNFTKKENNIGNFETVQQQKLGFSYFYQKKENLIVADFTFLDNNFNGNQNSPIAYQMLEGLQPGRNMTWNVNFNQKINNFLRLSLNYLGRKSVNSNTVHTGIVQLKAYF